MRSALPALPHNALQLPHLARALRHVHLPAPEHSQVVTNQACLSALAHACRPCGRQLGLPRAFLNRSWTAQRATTPHTYVYYNSSKSVCRHQYTSVQAHPPGGTPDPRAWRSRCRRRASGRRRAAARSRSRAGCWPRALCQAAAQSLGPGTQMSGCIVNLAANATLAAP